MYLKEKVTDFWVFLSCDEKTRVRWRILQLYEDIFFSIIRRDVPEVRPPLRIIYSLYRYLDVPRVRPYGRFIAVTDSIALLN